ncbi:hypothetical protein PI126_g11543 [Phytophthora idaei]|nr:hypothetical protein PI126_g11543 [Phytophthora idaei]
MAPAKPPPVGRPRLQGKGRHHTKHIIKSVSVAKKLAVLSFWANAPKPKMRHTINHFWRDLSPEHYNSKRTMIQRWRRSSAKLEEALKGHKGNHLKVRTVGVGTILSLEVELEIVAWVNSLRQEGVPVSPRMLAVHARQVATENGVNNFSASDKWIKGFKGRHRLNMRSPTRQSQISPEDIDKVKTDFAAEVAETARQLGITRIYNADPTAVFF